MGLYTKLIASAALITGFSGAVLADGHAGPTAETIVTTINGTDITLGEMIITRAQLPQQYQSLPDDVLWSGILDQLTQQQLLADTLNDAPDRVAYALANEERSLKAGEVINALNSEVLTDEAIRAAYDTRFAEFEGSTEYSAAHILVETEEEAAAIKLELDAGANFAQTAVEKSTGPSGPSGGDLGWFGAGMMVPPFEEAVIALEVGAVSDPVQTQFGWHIIMLNDSRMTEAPALEEVYPELQSEVQAAAIDARINELRDAAEITVVDTDTFDPAILKNLDLLED